MHGKRIPASPLPGSRTHHLQRVALLELLTAPPPGCDAIPVLAARCHEPAPEMHRAVEALVAAGLAECSGDVARASAAALYFEALFPAHP
jgi:hypothetical protein